MSSLFKRQKKKLAKEEIRVLDDEIKKLSNDPKIGEAKKGDLQGGYVYKFKVNRQELLLAYEYNDCRLYLIMIGYHENFYRNLKSYVNL
jgi:mRNA-degrading endonuclease RelE of RelBE toxin-antitoxin system